LITIEDISKVAPRDRGAFLAVGNFDGVHRGHSNLISRLRARADAKGVPAVVLTFDPHPALVLRPRQAPVPLVWTERKVDLLKKAGASEVGVFRTGTWLLRLSAREFFERVVIEQFGASGMVEGPNFGFGRDRGGDARLLAEWCQEAGLGFEIVEPTVVDGQLVSSSRVRALLAEGRADDAASLLGRPHRIRGLVAHGAARGAGLGFPTANLEEISTLIPGDGVYAGLAYLESRRIGWPAACHVGPNVSFGEQIRKVEAHLIDFEGDLYAQSIELDFLKRLRPSRKFEGLGDLLAQIRSDIEQARMVCALGLRS
jgi:riboflavin kinase/FMN adenylyltransferase